MEKMRDLFSYENPRFSMLKEPGRNVVKAYQNAARFLDTLKEWVWIETGMGYASEYIHNLAHEMPKRFDAFGDILHDYHLMVIYPATPELTEDIQDMEKVFAIAVDVLDDIDGALKEFVRAVEVGGHDDMKATLDALLEQNRNSYNGILQMWKMWEGCQSPGVFDSWVHQTFFSLSNGGDND